MIGNSLRISSSPFKTPRKAIFGLEQGTEVDIEARFIEIGLRVGEQAPADDDVIDRVPTPPLPPVKGSSCCVPKLVAIRRVRNAFTQ